jgi:hypothetical protein
MRHLHVLYLLLLHLPLSSYPGWREGECVAGLARRLQRLDHVTIAHAQEKHAHNQARQRSYYLLEKGQLGARARVLACTRMHTCKPQKATCASSRGQSPRRKDAM